MNESVILFWMIAGILTLIALGFILPSMIRKPRFTEIDVREQNISIAKERLNELQAERQAGKITEEVYQQTYNELERALLNDVAAESTNMSSGRSKLMVAVISIAVPILAITIYLQLGTSLEVINSAKRAPATEQHDLQSLAVMAGKLADKLNKQPNDVQGWAMLGRTYLILNQYSDASQAFEKAYALNENDPDIMLRYADALVMSRGGNFSGKPTELINKALEQRPNDITALWLAGMAAEQQGNAQQALLHWQKILPMVQQDPQTLAQVQSMISQVKSQLSQQQAIDSPVPEPGKPTTGTIALQVTVKLDPAIASKVAPADTVFIYAKAASGPPMPLAAARRQVGELPLSLTLDDSMAMMPSMKLSNFAVVNVGARISRSGQAIAQSGDFYNEITDIDVNSDKPLTIVIDKQKP